MCDHCNDSVKELISSTLFDEIVEQKDDILDTDEVREKFSTHYDRLRGEHASLRYAAFNGQLNEAQARDVFRAHTERFEMLKGRVEAFKNGEDIGEEEEESPYRRPRRSAIFQPHYKPHGGEEPPMVEPDEAEPTEEDGPKVFVNEDGTLDVTWDKPPAFVEEPNPPTEMAPPAWQKKMPLYEIKVENMEAIEMAPPPDVDQDLLKEVLLQQLENSGIDKFDKLSEELAEKLTNMGDEGSAEDSEVQSEPQEQTVNEEDTEIAQWAKEELAQELKKKYGVEVNDLDEDF